MTRTPAETTKPRRTQWRKRRYLPSKPSGAIVIHTSESSFRWRVADLINFIMKRAGPGSYHGGADRAREYKQIIPYAWEAFHVAARKGTTRGNGLSVGLSFICKASDWGQMTEQHEQNLLEAGAIGAADIIQWFDKTLGIKVPLKRLTPAEFWAGQPGFIGHGEIQGNRTDPGPNFPWTEFLKLTNQATRQTTQPEALTPEAELQTTLNKLGHNLAIDGDIGPLTIAATQQTLQHLPAIYEALDAVQAARTESVKQP